ncbi:hypothetical protein HMPREF0578_1838 [Mobiluncus mulieris 28-1]|nr:hypothetical protein HMPREF0578_1838 [Mobiluncus mulieris 28-1]
MNSRLTAPTAPSQRDKVRINPRSQALFRKSVASHVFPECGLSFWMAPHENESLVPPAEIAARA